MEKAESTRRSIVEQALQYASVNGLEAISIGLLADGMKMSKSGVFARFGSRASLQQAVVQRYRTQFEQDVLEPANGAAPGLARLQIMFYLSARHIGSLNAAGCFYFSEASEYDDRPGAVRDDLVAGVVAWRRAVESNIMAAIALGQFRATTNCDQVIFEMFGQLLAMQFEMRLLGRGGREDLALRTFDQLVQRCAQPGQDSRSVRPVGQRLAAVARAA
jgi:AcrR family transcriptional regulator